MPARTEKTSLRIGAVGLGQAGGNLAAEMHRRGYKALAINTASTDLRSLGTSDGLPEDARLFVGLDGTDGAGKDPDYGRACLDHHADRIASEVSSRFEGVDLLLILAGLGGGTGSNAATLWRILSQTSLPLGALVTLPTPSESGLVKVNAVRAAEAILDAPLHARMLVDNKRVSALHPNLDVLSFYREANASIIDPLDELNRLNGRAELRSVRSFDGEDLRKAVLGGGVVVPSVSTLDGKAITLKDLEEHVLASIDGGHVFSQGMAVQKVGVLAVVVVAPEETLKETRQQVFDDLEERLKQKTGGAAISMGVYTSKEKKPLLMVLSSSSGLPASVENLLNAARKEGQALSQKIHEELPRLDVSALSTMNLSRAPMPAAISRPPPARSSTTKPPAPRPIKEQVDPAMTDPLGKRPSFDDPPFTNPTNPKRAPEDEPAPDDAEELQKFYEELLARFKGPDRKVRERVGRRLIDDAKHENEDIRALSVWAMVAANDKAFKRALQAAVKDASEEVRKLAVEGVERLDKLGASDAE